LLPLVALEQHHIDLITGQVPGGAANIQDIYPLAPLQEGILFHHLLGSPEQGDTYIMPTVLTVKNRQHLERLIGALNAVVARHDILRTAVMWQGLPRAVQVVLRQAKLAVTELQLDASHDALTQLRERIAPEQLWMDLGQAPLLQVEVAAAPDSEQYFVLLYEHHIINDDVGLEVLMEELEAHLHSDDPQLPPPVPYREFVAHTLALADSGEMERYFRSRLGDVDEPTLPFGMTDIQVAPGDITEYVRSLDAAVAGKIRSHCQRLGISAASFFHLAWALVVGRCSGRDDVVFGTILSGRLQGTQGADRTLGLFINTLPIRLSLTESVHASLRSAHTELLALLKHEQAALSTVQACTGLAGDAPLFTSLLNYRRDLSTSWGPETDPVGHDGASIPLFDDIVDLGEGHERTNYPITIAVDDGEEGGFELVAQVTNTLDPERLIDYLQCAVTEMVTALESEPEQELGRIDILPASERNRLLVDFNQTQAAYPQAALIHQLFEAQVERTPHAPALSFEGVSLSYQELNRRSNQLAHYLIERGVKPDTLVGLYMERSLEMVVGLLGILKAGGAYVPMEPGYPASRLSYQLDNANLTIVLMQAELLDGSVVSTDKAVCLDAPEVQARLATYRDDNPSHGERGIRSNHLAYVIYTSGSTGQPKGVMIEHSALVNRIDWMQKEYALSARDTVLQKTPFSFDVSVWEFLWPLTHGSRLVVAQPEGHKDTDYLVDIIKAEAVTVLHFVPSMLRAMLSCGRWGECSSVKQVFSSGEALPKDLQDQFFATNAGSELHNLYGPTEAAIDVSYWPCASDDHTPVVPIGKPIQNIALYVTDEALNPTPMGVVGELMIGGAGLARGYLNKPELTAEKFIRNPFSTEPDSRLYRTGDLVRYLNDGNLEYIGRVDHQVKLRGFR
ncbi:MAG: non-ribosomal peptide synthetase, partial [Gammaproteobacteria bacterium]